MDKNNYAIQAEEPSMCCKFKLWLYSLKNDLAYGVKSRFERLSFWAMKRMINKDNLVQHAERELRLAGLFDKGSDYDGMLADAVLDLVRVFSLQGHSGFSAKLTLKYFGIVADFKTLTPISNNPEEWGDVYNSNGRPCWQNKRDSRCFSHNGGKTWHNIDDCVWIYETPNGSRWQAKSKGNKLPDLEEGEFFVREPKCRDCMEKETCDHAFVKAS